VNVEELADHIVRVDKTLSARKPVEEADKRVSIGVLYNDYRWGGPEATPLPPEALTALRLEEMSADGRWAKFFVNNPRNLGLYRSRVGYYWLLSYDAVRRDHVLQHAGTAGDALARFGSG
jgi:hypothetical protein